MKRVGDLFDGEHFSHEEVGLHAACFADRAFYDSADDTDTDGSDMPLHNACWRQ